LMGVIMAECTLQIYENLLGSIHPLKIFSKIVVAIF